MGIPAARSGASYYSPSPLAGEGCVGLANAVSLAEAGWGVAPLGAQRGSAYIEGPRFVVSQSPSTRLRQFRGDGEVASLSPCALASARTCRCATPIQLRLSSLRLAKPTHPSPARGEGGSWELREHLDP